jgi:hypothetical protein
MGGVKYLHETGQENSTLSQIKRRIVMSQWTNEELQKALTEVTRRATVDPNFRSLAISDGRKAIASINPKPLPSHMNFEFVDNSGPTKTIGLPDLIADAGVELNDLELASVAGGSTAPVLPGTKLGLTTPPPIGA